MIDISATRAIALDLVWAYRWYVLYRLNRATWRDLKSFRYRHRSGTESEHRDNRVVDDLRAVKLSKIIGRAALKSALEIDKRLSIDNLQPIQSLPITFVIPFGDMRGDRLPLLQACLSRMSKLFPDAEIIISDLVGTLSVHSLNCVSNGVRIIHGACDPNDFNIALAVNLGVLSAHHDNICIMQADVLATEGLCWALSGFLTQDVDFWFPACGIFFLDKVSTHQLLSGDERSLCPGSFCRELESYCIFIKREAFERVGGYCSQFTQLAEDNDFYDRLCDLRTIDARPLALCHLWHPAYGRMNPEIVQRNKQVLRERRAVPVNQRIADARERLALSKAESVDGLT